MFLPNQKWIQGVERGAMPPSRPVKNRPKKDGCRTQRLIFHVSCPPPFPKFLDPLLPINFVTTQLALLIHSCIWLHSMQNSRILSVDHSLPTTVQQPDVTCCSLTYNGLDMINLFYSTNQQG